MLILAIAIYIAGYLVTFVARSDFDDPDSSTLDLIGLSALWPITFVALIVISIWTAIDYVAAAAYRGLGGLYRAAGFGKTEEPEDTVFDSPPTPACCPDGMDDECNESLADDVNFIEQELKTLSSAISDFNKSKELTPVPGALPTQEMPQDEIDTKDIHVPADVRGTKKTLMGVGPLGDIKKPIIIPSVFGFYSDSTDPTDASGWNECTTFFYDPTAVKKDLADIEDLMAGFGDYDVSEPYVEGAPLPVTTFTPPKPKAKRTTKTTKATKKPKAKPATKAKKSSKK